VLRGRHSEIESSFPPIFAPKESSTLHFYLLTHLAFTEQRGIASGTGNKE
jgi:hypothetical protein